MKKPNEQLKKPTDQLEMDVQIKNIYGRDLVYPLNDLAKGLAEFIGKKTFSVDEVNSLQKLGIKVNWQLNGSK